MTVKYSIKNKLSVSRDIPDGYCYQYNVTPKSYVYSHSYSTASTPLAHDVVAELENLNPVVKARDIHLFEVLVAATTYCNGSATPLLDIRSMYNGNRTNISYRDQRTTPISFKQTKMKCIELIDNSTLFVIEPPSSWTVILNSNKHLVSTTIVDARDNFILGDCLKYGFNDYETILEQLCDYYDKLNTSQLEIDHFGFLAHINTYSPTVAETFIEMHDALLHNNPKKLKMLALSLIKVDYSESVKKKDNIHFDFSLLSTDNIVLSKLLNLYDFYEALDNVEGDVYITPSKKKYISYHPNDEKNRDKVHIVDSFYLFFKRLEDVEVFMGHYKPPNAKNETAFSLYNRNDITETERQNVYRFVSDDIKVFKEKTKNSNVRLVLSERKTPYFHTPVTHGYAYLSTFVFATNDLDNNRDDVMNKIEDIQSSFAKLGFDDDLLFVGGIKMYSRGIVKSHNGININDDVMLLDDIHCHYGTPNYHHTLDGAFKAQKKDFERRTNFISMHTQYLMMITIQLALPINIVDEHKSNSFIKLLNRQKLTGKIGDVKIGNVEFAPYSTTERKHTENIIQTISKM